MNLVLCIFIIIIFSFANSNIAIYTQCKSDTCHGTKTTQVSKTYSKFNFIIILIELVTPSQLHQRLREGCDIEIPDLTSNKLTF